jgi:hypothetical protein
MGGSSKAIKTRRATAWSIERTKARVPDILWYLLRLFLEAFFAFVGLAFLRLIDRAREGKAIGVQFGEAASFCIM